MNLLAIFQCTFIKEENSEKHISLNINYEDDNNKEFSEFTPCGNINLLISKGEGLNFFKEGKQYEVIFKEKKE